jgi:hypothetical protein
MNNERSFVLQKNKKNFSAAWVALELFLIKSEINEPCSKYARQKEFVT